MAPVGSYEALSAAIQAGAGSVYFGIGKLNMRSRSAKNFNLDDLKQIAEICNANGVKSYVTINTVIFDAEIEEMHQLVDAVKANGISAIIASDQSVIQYARQIGVEVHMSTQTNITNIEAVKYYSQFADVMVTARELNVNQVKRITEQIEQQQIRGPKLDENVKQAILAEATRRGYDVSRVISWLSPRQPTGAFPRFPRRKSPC